MAHQAVVEVDGQKIKLLECWYNVSTPKDFSGKPSDRARHGTIHLIKESEKDDTLFFEWSIDSSKTNHKKGKVTFSDPDSIEVLKVLEWEDGFISDYEERIESTGGETQMREKISISARKVKIGGAESDNEWPVKV
jgi:hypothetical protein